MSEITYDSELLERITAYSREYGIDISDLGRQIGYSRSAISRYLAGTYANPSEIEAALRGFLQSEERSGEGKFVDTRVARIVMESLEQAFTEKLFVVISGNPTIGKTAAAREFCRRKIKRNQRKLVFVTANAATTLKSLVDRIGEELGMTGKASAAKRLEDLAARLTGYLVIVDDASFLQVKTLEILRYLYDHAGCGLALMGTRTLMERIFPAVPSGRIAEDLEQLYSRVDLQRLIPGGLAQKERREIAQRHGHSLAKDELDLLAQENVEPRTLVKLIRRVNYLRRCNADEKFSELLNVARQEIFRAA